MSFAELAMRNGTLAWALSVAVLVLGCLAYFDLPRLEYREIPIREARIITPYPGASAAEVEQEVSRRIEMAAKGLGQTRRVESYSSRGLSVVSVFVRDEVSKDRLPLVWDELRRKVAEQQPELPPGAGPSVLDDSLGDVYGIYYALTGDGFTPAELRRVAELLRRELSGLDGVTKAILFGDQQERIFVDVSRAKSRDIDIAEVISALGSKNLPADAGHIDTGPENIAIHPGSLYRSEQELGDLMLAGDDDRLIRLGDIAEIRRDYADPPRQLLRIDGRPAVGIAISTQVGCDPVKAGHSIKQRVAELSSEIPLGMELDVIADQSQAIAAISHEYRIKLALTMGVVLLALLLFMGPRAGLLAGFITLLTMAGTFVVMDWLLIPLERVSQGALLIALGLAPTNAILILHEMKLLMAQGLTGVAAAWETLARNALALFAATLVAILALVPIAGVTGSAGEYSRGLLIVIVTALAASWVMAVGIVPFFAGQFLGAGASSGKETALDDGPFQRGYSAVLAAAMRHRWLIVGATTLLVLLSWYGFGFVEQARFPPSNAPTLLVEVHFRQGTHIREAEHQMDEMQDFLSSQQGITQVATAIGGDHPRYCVLCGSGLEAGGQYAVSLVSVGDPEHIEALETRIRAHLDERFPDAAIHVKWGSLGPEPAGGRIQLRISGPDPAELRRKADLAKAIMGTDPNATAIRDDWGAKVKVAHLVLAQDRAHRLRIDRSRIAAALRTQYRGTTTGVLREGRNLIPIVVRASKEDRSKVEDMTNIAVTSPLRGDRVGIHKLAERLETRTEDARRNRRDGLPTITLHADVGMGSSSELLGRIKAKVETALGVDLAEYLSRNAGPDDEIGPNVIPIVPDDTIPLAGKPGYFIAWGGEGESAAESQAQLWSWLPLSSALILLVLIALFNALRQALIVLLAVPLAIAGGAAGLLLAGQPLDFLSLLALLGLSGLSMRTAVVLLGGIDKEVHTGGKPRLTAICDGARSRLRPLALATGVSLLAMLPLLWDQHFVAMAVTLIGGLGIATLLILLVVPVLYATLLGLGKGEAS